MVSLNWLNERLDLSGKSVDELDDLLTFAGIEVEGVHVQGPATDRVVVAVVVAAEKHPNADRLKVCQVETGEGAPRQIVCGAQNYRVGDKVPCALPGAKLPSGLEIKNGKLRGIESAGMLCSASELGYTDAEDGLMILPTATPLGQPVRERQVIALSGSTGRSTGPHLHFEILVDGTPVDPLTLVAQPS